MARIKKEDVPLPDILFLFNVALSSQELSSLFYNIEQPWRVVASFHKGKLGAWRSDRRIPALGFLQRTE